MTLAEKKHISYLLGIALILRLVHLSSAASNPITYNPGPDEAFYLAFGADVMNGGWGLGEVFGFMDPLYGYFVGAAFAVVGENLFVIYLLQLIIDVATVYFVYLAGRHCFSHRAGLFAGGAYALAGTALFYTTTLLKPTLAAFVVSVWTCATLRLGRDGTTFSAVMYGMLLGLAVALRSNFLLLAVAGLMFALVWPRGVTPAEPAKRSRALWVVAGFLLVMVLLAARNHAIYGEWRSLPANSGVVLHQLYNPGNPHSLEYYPEFVSYGSPDSILSGYQREASRRLQGEVSQYDMSAYWRAQALGYIGENPAQVMSGVLRKATEFLSYSEIANNRSYNLERQFSPVLSVLSYPFGLLLALGVPGLVLIGYRSRRDLLICLVPLLTVFATFVLFIAASRFRLPGVPILAIGTGVALAVVFDGQTRAAVRLRLLVAASIAFLVSVVAASYASTGNDNRVALAWGYVKMGSPDRAIEMLTPNGGEPLTPAGLDVLGFVALQQNDNGAAAGYYARSLALSPARHISSYNLSLAYTRSGNFPEALKAIESALAVAELPEYRYQQAQVFEHMGLTERAASIYGALITSPSDGQDGSGYSGLAREALDAMGRTAPP